MIDALRNIDPRNVREQQRARAERDEGRGGI
jgi:hypothetical protein